MKRHVSMSVLFVVGCFLGGAAGAETVLQLYSTNVVSLVVQGGVWSCQGDFAHNSNAYGGKSYSFKGLASDGRSVFIGEQGGTSSRILEFDLEGNYRRVFKTIGKTVEHMAVSPDGQGLYINVEPNFSAETTNAVVYRYDIPSGTGGVFIPNEGTNELGQTLWKFQVHRGVAVDTNGCVWVSERSSGKVYKFSATDGAFLGAVSGLSGVEALYFCAEDAKVYGTSMGDSTYVIDTATGTAVTRGISGADNRLGITRADGRFCSARYTYGDISGYDFDTLTRTLLVSLPVQPRELITLPGSPLRPKLGEILIAETVSNRITRVSIDSANVTDLEPEPFAGGDGERYDGVPLRQPRGLAVFSNTVYVAEGVAGGRILKFSKWGTYKRVVADFSQTAFSNCVPAALAVSPDGGSLYVTDVRTLYIAGSGLAWSNVMPNGYLDGHAYGDAVYKVGAASGGVSVFADRANIASGNELVEPRGVAVDGDGNVYFTSWYNSTGALYSATGRIYYFNAAGVMQTVVAEGNTSCCYYDPVSVYDPPAGNVPGSGPAVLLSGFGMQDFFWTQAGGSLTTRPKLLDNGYWRTYLDVEVVNGRLWYTDPENGILWLRTGDAARSAAVTGLDEPTYLTFVSETGPEPPPPATLISVK